MAQSLSALSPRRAGGQSSQTEVVKTRKKGRECLCLKQRTKRIALRLYKPLSPARLGLKINTQTDPATGQEIPYNPTPLFSCSVLSADAQQHNPILEQTEKGSLCFQSARLKTAASWKKVKREESGRERGERGRGGGRERRRGGERGMREGEERGERGRDREDRRHISEAGGGGGGGLSQFCGGNRPWGGGGGTTTHPPTLAEVCSTVLRTHWCQSNTVWFLHKLGCIIYLSWKSIHSVSLILFWVLLKVEVSWNMSSGDQLFL